jgi:hypothetical protein
MFSDAVMAFVTEVAHSTVVAHNTLLNTIVTHMEAQIFLRKCANVLTVVRTSQVIQTSVVGQFTDSHYLIAGV